MRFIKPACFYKVWFTKLSIFYKVQFIDPTFFTPLSRIIILSAGLGGVGAPVAMPRRRGAEGRAASFLRDKMKHDAKNCYLCRINCLVGNGRRVRPLLHAGYLSTTLWAKPLH